MPLAPRHLSPGSADRHWIEHLHEGQLILILSLAAHPNPFNPETMITFTLPKASVVTVIVFNGRGEVVDLLIDHENRGAGVHSLRDTSEAASGIYFVRMVGGSQTVTKKLVLTE